MDWLPELITLTESGGDWDAYEERLYDQFCNDFIRSRPILDGESVGVTRTPIVDGRELSFWHLISQGDVEEERLPDMRRCERIAWPRAIIDNAEGDDVHWWRSRGKVVVTPSDFRHKVVIVQRKGYKLLLTAYTIEREHTRRKLEKEWQSVRGRK